MSNSVQINFVTKDEFKQVQLGALDLIKEILNYVANPAESSLISDFDKALEETLGVTLEDVSRDQLDAFVIASLTKTCLVKGNQ
jgi:hypothetical protein